MRSMQVKQVCSTAVETSVDFASLFVFSRKDCFVDLSMHDSGISVRLWQSMASRSVSI